MGIAAQTRKAPVLSFFLRAEFDARHDPFFPCPAWRAWAWVLWNWRWLRRDYAAWDCRH